ncbi:MAG: hypothetical protein ABIS09_08505, partial [Sphingomicrobium sp.]
MPNLKTDRGLWVAGTGGPLNMRRLMYQLLIWPGVLVNDARRLRAAFDAEHVKRLADTLVDGMRRNSKLGRNLLGQEVLVDEPKAIELSRRQPFESRLHHVVLRRFVGDTSGCGGIGRRFQVPVHSERDALTWSRRARPR